MMENLPCQSYTTNASTAGLCKGERGEAMWGGQGLNRQILL